MVRKLAIPLLLILGAVWLGAREHHYSRWMDDDAFISFRYARNFAEGHGLTFNPGERVEGYTNFLWTLLLSFGARVGLDVPHTAQALGIAFSFLILPLLLLFHRSGLLAGQSDTRQGMSWLAATSVLLLCGAESWAVWAVSGLENVFGAFLVVLGFFFYAGYLVRPKRMRLAGAAVALALAAMTHPSYALFLVVVAAHAAMFRQSMRGLRRDAAVAALLVLALDGTWFAWRLYYYGHPMPNTFYAKVGLTPYALERGLRYYGGMVAAYPILFGALIAVPILLRRQRARNPAAWLLVGAVLVYSLYIIAIGGDAFPAFRLVVVLLPLLALLVQVALQLVYVPAATHAAPVASGGAPRRRAAVLPVLAATVLCGAAVSYANSQVRVLDRAVQLDLLGLYRTAARLLKQNLPPSTLFAYGGAGVLAYDTRFPFIDTLGLTDAHIGMSTARSLGRGIAGHEKGDGAYVLSRRPDYIMFDGSPISSREPRRKGDLELFQIPEFRTEYQLIRVPFQFQSAPNAPPRAYELFLYQRIRR